MRGIATQCRFAGRPAFQATVGAHETRHFQFEMRRMLVSCLANIHNTTDLPLDLAGGLRPAERLGGLIPVCEVAVDGSFKGADAVEAAAPDGLGGDQGKPSLDQSVSCYGYFRDRTLEQSKTQDGSG